MALSGWGRRWRGGVADGGSGWWGVHERWRGVRPHSGLMPTPFPSMVQHSHDNDFLQRRSPTAVCLAGEARSIASPRVRVMLTQNLLHPLNADLFLAMSPTWSGHEEQSLSARVVDQLMSDLRPVSTVIADDSDALRILIKVLGGARSQKLQDVVECTSHQPLPLKRYENEGEDLGKATFRYRVAHNQLGPCSPQLSLAIRLQTCHSLIEFAERQRDGRQYTWVVRSRPDIALPCALPMAALPHDAVFFQDDFFAMMPRAAAEVSLQQLPLARRFNASECYVDIMRSLPEAWTKLEGEEDFAYWHPMERCNPCLVGWVCPPHTQWDTWPADAPTSLTIEGCVRRVSRCRLAGWPTGSLGLRAWSESEGRTIDFLMAYPSYLHMHDLEAAVLEPKPYPPFGSVPCPDCGVPLDLMNCTATVGFADAIARREREARGRGWRTGRERLPRLQMVLSEIRAPHRLCFNSSDAPRALRGGAGLKSTARRGAASQTPSST